MLPSATAAAARGSGRIGDVDVDREVRGANTFWLSEVGGSTVSSLRLMNAVGESVVEPERVPVLESVLVLMLDEVAPLPLPRTMPSDSAAALLAP